MSTSFTPTRKRIFHLLPNAHLDPVWLWDWREGLNEGLKTVDTVLNLMGEFPQLTFVRGESAIYQHIEKTRPDMFRRIIKMIEAGRWDVIGGTVIQPDSNLPATESLCRQYETGLAYFESRFGRRPTIAWQADTFGHTPGWPNILTSFGMEGFAFTRPQRKDFPLENPLFWWEGDHRNRLLCYRQHWLWYCSERGNLVEILDTTLAGSANNPHQHVGVFMGLGNHGGGPTRRHIHEAEQWQKKHPEVEIRYSTLHGLFAALREELPALSKKDVPVVRGDLGYCLRGCYSSVQKFKSLYRKAETHLVQAEAANALIGQGIQLPPDALEDAWNSVLFNAFHDILPGTSVERAFEDQIAWTDFAIHRAVDVKFDALNALAAEVDTTVPPPIDPDRPTDTPFLVWNPQPKPFNGVVELECSLDYRPIWAYENRPNEVPIVAFDHAGKPLPFQEIQTEHTSMPTQPWRKRVVVPLQIPALGWTVARVGYRDKSPKIKGHCSAKNTKTPSITNGDWKVEAKNGAVKITRGGKNLFSGTGSLGFRVVEDPWGSWGGMNEEKGAINQETIREKWALKKAAVIESGPLRSKLWTRWQGKNSWIELTFAVSENTPWLAVDARLLWNERSARLKLVLPCRGAVEFDVPASRVYRDLKSNLPMGRWIRRVQGKTSVGFASDVLSDADFVPNELRITMARASRYANDDNTGPTEKPWQPAVDCGELKFQFRFFGADQSPDVVVDNLLFAPNVLLPLAAKGPLPTQGSLASLQPATVRLLSLKRSPKGQLQVRVQNRGDKTASATFQLGAGKHALGKLGPQEIRTVILPSTNSS